MLFVLWHRKYDIVWLVTLLIHGRAVVVVMFVFLPTRDALACTSLDCPVVHGVSSKSRRGPQRLRHDRLLFLLSDHTHDARRGVRVGPRPRRLEERRRALEEKEVVGAQRGCCCFRENPISRHL